MATFYLSFTDFIYVRLTAIIWIKNGLINLDNLSKNSGDALKETYELIETNKPIVIDCKNVLNIIDHSLDLLFEKIAEIKRPVYFINCSSIENFISSLNKEFCNKVENPKSTYSTADNNVSICYRPPFPIVYQDLSIVLKKLYRNVSDFIVASFCLHDSSTKKILPSTPFYANGEYNATKIISDANAFMWTCILFADYIQIKINQYRIGSDIRYPLKFLSVSLRSSPFAAAVSLILNYHLQTIEYLGPKRDSIYLNANNKSGQYEYIYIGDFAFAGTEIRITKMYASLTNARLKHAFVLGSLLPKEAFLDFSLHSLADLKKINPNAKYSLFNDEE